MRPNKDRRTEIILYGLLLIPLLFTAAALAQATEQAQGLAEITAVLSEILHTPSMLRWCASTPKFLLAVLMLYPLAVYCYMLDQADRHPGAEHGTAKWGSAHRLNIKYRNTKDSKENYIVFYAQHMAADVVAPPAITDIAGSSCKIRLETQRIPCDDCIAGKTDGIPMTAGAAIARKRHWTLISLIVI